MKQHSVIFTVFLITIFVVPSALAIPITVTGNNVISAAGDSPVGSNSDTYNGTTVPASLTLTTTSGNSSSNTNINYSGDANSATFSVDMAHSIDNTGGLSTPGCCDIADTFNSLSFTADVNTTYSISGFYDMLGSVGTLTSLEVTLEDQSTRDILFYGLSQSLNTTNESFVLGGLADGDTNNFLSGSLTGNLIAGRDYMFRFDSYIRSSGTAGIETEVAASARGNVTLVIATPLSAVPIPAAVWLFGSGLFGLVVVARKRVN